MIDLKYAFQSLNIEISDVPLPVVGQIPEWLQGFFIRNGPAKFEMSNEQLNHWFDGFAMLHRFHIHDSKIIYTNKFIESEAYQKGLKQNKVCLEEFATMPKTNWLGKIKRIVKPAPTDNTNVNVTTVSGQHLALTETCRYNAFDPATLNTLGPFQYDDKIPGILTSAHPHYDFQRNEVYNYTVKIGPGSAYYIYKIRAQSKSRVLLTKIPVKNPSYMHSFVMTENFIVLIEPPMLLNQLQFIFSRKPFIQNYHWKPEVGTRFTVIDKNDGEIKFKKTTEAFFLFHQINAYELKENIIIDAPTFTDTKIIDDMYLNRLIKNGISKPQTNRFLLNIRHKTISKTALSDAHIELPRIHYKRNNGRPYQYTYAVGLHNKEHFFQFLVKLDIHTGNYKTWEQPQCIPSEPVFVANPKTAQEDDGVILSVVLDTLKRKSFLLILNAANFEEQATAELPHGIPYGLHGNFYSTR